MILNTKLKEIYKVFFHKDTQYILFSVENIDFHFLYILNTKGNRYSLVYGENFFQKISNLLDIDSCIECNLGTLIRGGISKDQADIVEFGLNCRIANQILDNLCQFLRKNNSDISNKIEFVKFHLRGLK